MSEELAGKVAIVTGAGRMRSIGRPIARLLAGAGAAVVITGTGRAPDRYPDDEKAAGWRDIESVADEIRAAGGTCLPLVSDVANEAAIDELVARTVRELGRLDIVVNNASAARGDDRHAIEKLEYAAWRRVFATNLDGVFLMSRAATRQMLSQGGGGSIVNISSTAALTADPFQAAYSTSKAAVNTLSRAHAMEVARHGIRVNAVCPGITDTSRLDGYGRGEAWEDIIKKRIPLGYAGDGSEVAEMVLFLVSDRGKWITGQEIVVDGGAVWH